MTRYLTAAVLLAALAAGAAVAKNKHRHEADCLAGTLSGALLGGGLGSLFGEGEGQEIFTAAGAAAGGVEANQLACKK